MNSPYIVFAAPDIHDEEINEVSACLRSGWLGTGPRVARFEAAFAGYKGVDASQVAGLNSCTAALHIAMLALELEPGSEVITTPLTFCATANAIIHAGLVPVLADVDPVTQNIDPAAIEAAITPRTSAILPVHFAGRPCEMDRITAIAERHGLALIEDCAHAIETEYKGRKAGTFGDFGCFSFYVTKNVATGEGGMVLGRDASRIARAKVLSLHGMSKDAWHRFSDSGYKHYQVVESGFKYNMMDLQAAIGIHQLARVEASWQRRQAIWSVYETALAHLPVTLPAPAAPETKHARHLFNLLIDPEASGITRDRFLEAMHEAGIGTGVHYLSLAEHPVYQERFGWRPEQWPHAMRLGRTTASLPLSPKLTEHDIARVCRATENCLTGG
ncbi:DegT/DnrJ/EryC1/StrS family aminotransferase [Lysobacter sp. SG-8]|uniref:DegT/DnrJ/EryC1/StrS family aminotransferase n=1 Tax=Marilutibacter penaei TaxID=2759900 RepID=A0A7W3U4U2_9GAMM|nr:DegT/DnrJ/EryC1/StrS family aminotransferase [Lysobacter penaei]